MFLRKKLSNLQCGKQMLLGQHNLFIDEQANIKLSESIRGFYSEGAYITQGFDRNLLLLTEQAFLVIVNKLKTLNIADPLARLLLRLIMGSASEIKFDASGRIKIPQRLQDIADIHSDIVIVGQGDYCEIWSQENWINQESILHNQQDNSDRFASLNLNME
ncbi:MAG: hypothetical protein QGM50_00785 [Anaerolineae bacterium]|nr:hypothetical protein [Anaerolineae bacterium]MDK1080232.1 hypothetical protein [Anaerolineae bacterium]MDK1117301.1 hypothetical protein [Anaerolineae bacterium]